MYYYYYPGRPKLGRPGKEIRFRTLYSLSYTTAIYFKGRFLCSDDSTPRFVGAEGESENHGNPWVEIMRMHVQGRFGAACLFS